ncbi:hypothetical protein J3458_019497 [Metarhizium acridum]|uniref:uncharacterized protein n=1 Tax=Metarhizium acridum TaxID=92637 RepID=UPI001C6B89E3|nr:hypothetical protein J3458_019497 [Metarhizium acridum]
MSSHADTPFTIHLLWYRSTEWALAFGHVDEPPEWCDAYGPAYQNGVVARHFRFARNSPTQPLVRMALPLCTVNEATMTDITRQIFFYFDVGDIETAKSFIIKAWDWLRREKVVSEETHSEAQRKLEICDAAPQETDEQIYKVVQSEGGVFVGKDCRELWSKGKLVRKWKRCCDQWCEVGI